MSLLVALGQLLLFLDRCVALGSNRDDPHVYCPKRLNERRYQYLSHHRLTL